MPKKMRRYFKKRVCRSMKLHYSWLISLDQTALLNCCKQINLLNYPTYLVTMPSIVINPFSKAKPLGNYWNGHARKCRSVNVNWKSVPNYATLKLTALKSLLKAGKNLRNV